MERRPYQEFGKRRPDAVRPSGPVKRSSRVALLLMGTFAVGGGAYALMPRENCQPPAPGMAAPATPVALQAGTNCSPRSWWGGGGHGSWGRSWSSRSSFFSSDGSSSHSSSGGASDAGSGGVARGGFGSFAHAFSAHFSGGG